MEKQLDLNTWTPRIPGCFRRCGITSSTVSMTGTSMTGRGVSFLIERHDYPVQMTDIKFGLPFESSRMR